MTSGRPFLRRRVLQIAAAAAGLALLPPPARGGLRRGAPEAPLLVWNGAALGAPARILLSVPDAAAARRLIAACVAEIERLEGVLSLYRPDSELSRLNETGRLLAPSLDLLALLEESRRVSRASGGAFDVTVQPLWRALARHFAHDPTSPPPPETIERARALVDYRAVEIGGAAVTLPPGMAVTLNGIAQGYVTDRIADLLRDAGMKRVLVDMGELRALGAHPDGRPWRIGIEDPRRRGDAEQVTGLVDGALATSAPAGTVFDGEGRYHHLLDVRTGLSASLCRSVSVLAPRAVTADALSTALAVTPPEGHAVLMRALGPAEAMLTLADGRRLRLG